MKILTYVYMKISKIGKDIKVIDKEIKRLSKNRNNEKEVLKQVIDDIKNEENEEQRILLRENLLNFRNYNNKEKIKFMKMFIDYKKKKFKQK